MSIIPITDKEMKDAIQIAIAANNAEWVDWLYEPCKEHCVVPVEQRPTMFIAADRWVHKQHRKDCPECMKERKKEIGI